MEPPPYVRLAHDGFSLATGGWGDTSSTAAALAGGAALLVFGQLTFLDSPLQLVLAGGVALLALFFGAFAVQNARRTELRVSGREVVGRSTLLGQGHEVRIPLDASVVVSSRAWRAGQAVHHTLTVRRGDRSFDVVLPHHRNQPPARGQEEAAWLVAAIEAVRDGVEEEPVEAEAEARRALARVRSAERPG